MKKMVVQIIPYTPALLTATISHLLVLFRGCKFFGHLLHQFSAQHLALPRRQEESRGSKIIGISLATASLVQVELLSSLARASPALKRAVRTQGANLHWGPSFPRIKLSINPTSVITPCI